MEEIQESLKGNDEEWGVAKDLLLTEELEDVIVKYKGKKFRFRKKKELSFGEVVRLIEKSRGVDGEISFEKLYYNSIEVFYVETPPGWSKGIIEKLPLEVVKQLIEPLPSPEKLLGTEDIEKKQDKQ